MNKRKPEIFPFGPIWLTVVCPCLVLELRWVAQQDSRLGKGLTSRFLFNSHLNQKKIKFEDFLVFIVESMVNNHLPIACLTVI
jgi:hypothetical protein